MPLCSKYCEYFIPPPRLCYLFKSSEANGGAREALLWRADVDYAGGLQLRLSGPQATFVWSLLRAAGGKKVHEPH